MTDLTEWLRAQLDEDERACREEVAAMELFRSQQDPTAVDAIWVPPLSLAGNPADPDRVLIEVESKRRILDACDWGSYDERVTFGDWESCSDSCPPTIMWEVAKLLALPYAGRPGYREEWAPTERPTPI